MRCVSCGEDIPPKWVAVIEKNKCPSCDGPIMTEDAIQLKTELADALSRMPNDPQGITGWLLSNYRVQKIGDAEPVERFNRPGAQPEQSTNPQQGGPQLKEFKVAQSPYDEFLARTDMKNKISETNATVRTKQDRMAQMAANISSVNDPYGDLETSDAAPTPAEDQEDYNALQAMLAQVSNGAQNSMTKQGSSQGNGGALSPEQIANMQGHDMANMDIDGVARANVGYNDGELSKEEQDLINRTGQAGHKVVHNNRLKRIKAQEAIDMGGGSFTRSG